MEISRSLSEFWEECSNKKTPLVLWGTGECCDAYCTILHLGDITPVCVSDKDEKKFGAFFKGTPIMSLPEILQTYHNFNILISVDSDIEDTEANYLLKYFMFVEQTNQVKLFCLDNKGTLSAELLTYYRKAQLLRQDFSIISNSCWAYDIYGYLDILPRTPTSRIIIWPLHYVRFLENMDYYLSLPLKFKGNYITPRQDYSNIHVVGTLNDIDIHFVHDVNFNDASDRWSDGVRNINRENLFVIMEDAHFPLTHKIAERFDKLPFSNRILLTPHDYGDLRSVCRYSNDKIWLKAVLNINHYIRYERFDFIKWFNCGGVGQDFEVKHLCDDLPNDYVEWLYGGGMPIYSKIYKLMLY